MSPGWSAGLTVTGDHGWPVEPAAEETASGLIGVLVAREAGRERVSVCAWLVDVYCLGVKNDLGPQVVHRSELPRIVHDFFAVFGERPLAAPLELAQQLVLGAVEYARARGAKTAAVTCNLNTPLSDAADTTVIADVGPEILSGSTRMKSATAQKMILNMITTGAMTRLGYVYDNLMVNVHMKNAKLVERGIRVLMKVCDIDRDTAIRTIKSAGAAGIGRSAPG